jgi:hypothetical protein
MTAGSIIFMILILGLYGGGFIFFINKAFKAKSK